MQFIYRTICNAQKCLNSLFEFLQAPSTMFEGIEIELLLI